MSITIIYVHIYIYVCSSFFFFSFGVYNQVEVVVFMSGELSTDVEVQNRPIYTTIRITNPTRIGYGTD